MQFKGKHIDPYESFYWDVTDRFNRGQLGGGISRTVKTTDSLAVMEEIIVYDDYNSRIAKEQNVIGTITTNIGNNAPRNGIKIIEVNKTKEPKIVVMRGRNPDNPNERGKSNGNYQQRLEVNENGTSNTITSVQKDNLVVEPLNPYEDGTARTIKSQYYKNGRANFARQDGLGATGVVQIGNIVDDSNIGFKNPQRGRVDSAAGLSPCLNCCEGGGLEPKVVEDWQTVVGNKQLNPFRGSVEDTSPCITSACGAGGGMTPMLTDAPLEITKTKDFIEQVRGHEPMRYRIRKLTPRECFRLMGCDEETIDTIQAARISNSQQYKLAGNSIVVDVLYHLFRKMFVETENESQQLTLF